MKRKRQILFYLVLGLSFLCVLSYNILTPYLSDDLFYIQQVRGASSYLEVVRFNAAEYISNNCRFIDQLLMRTFFYTGNKLWSDLFGSALFTLLGWLIYKNARLSDKYDIRVIILTFLLMWSCLVDFGDTVLWKAGAASYLYGSVWIMSFITLYRSLLDSRQIKHPLLSNIVLLLLGFAAGMSNENTSGGAFVIVFLLTVNKLWNQREHGIKLRDGLRPYMLIGNLSVVVGLGFLVLGPGSSNRRALIDQGTYTGLVGFLSHLYKVTMSVREVLLPLLILIVAVLVILVVQGRYRSFSEIRNESGFIFLLSAFLTTYVMAVMEPVSNRAYFGASVFLITALVRFLSRLELKLEGNKILVSLLLCLGCLWFSFTYLDNLVNLARIYREENERIELLLNARESGNAVDVVVPQYRPQWDNPYTTAYGNDMTEDASYWINIFYEEFYEIDGIYAVPREEWEENYREVN